MSYLKIFEYADIFCVLTTYFALELNNALLGFLCCCTSSEVLLSGTEPTKMLIDGYQAFIPMEHTY